MERLLYVQKDNVVEWINATTRDWQSEEGEGESRAGWETRGCGQQIGDNDVNERPRPATADGTRTLTNSVVTVASLPHGFRPTLHVPVTIHGEDVVQVVTNA